VLLLIGQFSRLTGLSCRMLRFYAEQHVLVPAYTDPHTGYRHYLASQLEEARFLLRLRRADFSVEDIRSIMGGELPEEESLCGLGEEQRRGLKRKIQALEDSLRELESLEREWDLPRYGLLQVKPLPGYSISFRGERERLRELARDAAERLMEASPGALRGAPFLCTYNLEKGPGEAVLHLPGEGVCPHVLSGGSVAVVLHRGSCAELPETLKGLLQWVECQGQVPQGTVRECYLPPGEEGNSFGHVEISLPLVEREP
jgi:DNA-binding transcriptional MerR regulator